MRYVVSLFVLSAIGHFGTWATEQAQPGRSCSFELSGIVTRGDLTITRAGRVYWKGEEVFLREVGWKKNNPTILKFLLKLVDKPNNVVLRKVLHESVWSNPFAVGDQRSNEAANKLRAYFREIDPQFNAIQTIMGVGYLWKDDIENSAIEIDGAKIIPQMRQVFWNEQFVQLSRGNFRIVYVLLRNLNRPVENSFLYNWYRNDPNAWSDGDRKGLLRVLKTEFYQINRAFQAVDPGFNRIETWSGKARVWRSSRALGL